MTIELILTIFGTVTGVIGLYLARYYYLLAKPTLKIAASFDSTTLISKNRSENISELEILYRGKKVDNLSAANLIFWNTGNRPIRRADFMDPDEAFRIIVDGGVDLARFEIAVESDSRNGAKIRLLQADSSCLIIEFDFLEVNQGFRVEILYSGVPLSPIFKHSIVGHEGFISKAKTNEIFRVMDWCIGALALICLIIFINMFYSIVIIVFDDALLSSDTFFQFLGINHVASKIEYFLNLYLNLSVDPTFIKFIRCVSILITSISSFAVVMALAELLEKILGRDPSLPPSALLAKTVNSVRLERSVRRNRDENNVARPVEEPKK
jgi:hypothetical protein